MANSSERSDLRARLIQLPWRLRILGEVGHGSYLETVSEGLFALLAAETTGKSGTRDLRSDVPRDNPAPRWPPSFSGDPFGAFFPRPRQLRACQDCEPTLLATHP